MFNNFKSKIKFACTHVLPLVFDSSLSYYETLCKLTKKSNEIIEQVNKNSIRLEGIIDSDKFVVDQTYDPTSSDAQSGKAVAEAIQGVQISIPIDQTYDPESSNPQSGTAVAEAIEEISEAKLTIDQNYNPVSVNAQSGKAVAEAISSIGNFNVDESYKPLSPNPQSGTAVAEAIASIEPIVVAQTYNPVSEKAQSGKAVAEGIQQAIDGLDIPTPNTVDQTYDPESSNPQSGTAVAEAIEAINVNSPFSFVQFTSPIMISKWEEIHNNLYTLHQDILLNYYNENERYLITDAFGRVYSYNLQAGLNSQSEPVNLLEIYHYGDPTDSNVIGTSSGFSLIIFKMNLPA